MLNVLLLSCVLFLCCVRAFGLPPFIPVPEQIEADPDFPTVKFPNPEEGAGALALSFRTADANSQHTAA